VGGDWVLPGGDQEGCQIFVDVLTRFAEQNRNPRLTPIIRRIGAPLRIAVRGRDGVGRATVAEALIAAGVAVTDGDAAADVDALVIAEALKHEDRYLIESANRPALIILNKADLSGFGAGGPLAVAHRRAADYRALTSVPTVPMVGLLATADLDDELIGALRALVHEPADLTSTDAFVQCAHPLPRDVRQRLLDALDRFGIAHAVLAMGDRSHEAEASDADALRALLRRLSLIDRVVAHVDAAGAPVRYRRLRSAITELRVLATKTSDHQLAEFLSTDATVLAMMAAAVSVVEAAGVKVDRTDDPNAHLGRAVHWHRYGRGPVDDLHRRCSADICRGSLRLLGESR
jgi:hypothetical protein